MNKYLLVAEADQIQDFVFGASRLQEVMGGSQLLSQFCQQAPKELGAAQENTLANAGGKFILEFETQDKAIDFGEYLAEAYRQWADGSLTVAPPVEIGNGDFRAAIDKAEKALRKVKCWRERRQASVHLPYIALCTSCGAGLAVDYQSRFKDESDKYVCRACLAKADRQQKQGKKFLQDFAKRINPDSTYELDLTTRPKHISKQDPRRYVAYLVADGNNMGQIFEACNRDQLRRLSQEMQEKILPNALVETTKTLMEQANLQGQIPVWPLILGGDDVFALLPAPWSLDFTLRFCQKFEQETQKFINNELGLGLLKPTISAGLVICKETYPHHLAHQIGKQCLDRAKQLSKTLKNKTGEALSTVDFEIITGSQSPLQSSAKLRPTLRPYYVLTDDANSAQRTQEIYAHLGEKTQTKLTSLSEWGLPLHRLIQQRWALEYIPQKRLHQLRAIFDRLSGGMERKADWLAEIEKLVQRTTTHNEQTGKAIRHALIELGNLNVNDKNPDYLLEVERSFDAEEWFGHGLPDLLMMWDFAFSLDKERAEYGEA